MALLVILRLTYSGSKSNNEGKGSGEPSDNVSCGITGDEVTRSVLFPMKLGWILFQSFEINFLKGWVQKLSLRNVHIQQSYKEMKTFLGSPDDISYTAASRLSRAFS